MSNKSSEKEDKDAAAFTVNNSDQDLYGGTYHSSRKVHWYRSTLWQTIVVGVASFLAPGVYNALAATGAGGLADVNIGNASTAVAYALIVPSALISTACLSKLGARWTLVIGACGYAPFAASLYTNSAFRNQWFLIVGAVICGLTSGLFWVAEGAIIMIYSEPERKGRYLALWQSIYQLATIVGGAVNLALNVRGTTGAGLSPQTYLAFVAMNCLAPFAAAFVSNPDKVQRKDGKPVPAFPSGGFWEETWKTLAELRNPRIVACAFLWSQCLFIPSYLSTYLARHFSTRVRSLTSLVGPVLAIIFFQIIGVTLDNRKIKTRYRLLVTWTFLQVLGIATTAWLLVYNYKLEAITPRPRYDWSDPGFAAAWIPCVVGRVVAWVNYGYNYYMAGFVFPRDADGVRVSRIIATLRSAESGSAAIAFGINALGLALVKIGWINMAFNLVIFACGAYVLQYIWVSDKAGLFDEPSALEVAAAQPAVPINDDRAR